MTQTEWIVSIDDDMKDYDEMFVGNVRDGERLIRCRDCAYFKAFREGGFHHYCSLTGGVIYGDDFCSKAERRGEE